MAQRMRSAGMYKAWTAWLENATELRRQRSLVEKISLRMRGLLIRTLPSKSFDVWQFQVRGFYSFWVTAKISYVVFRCFVFPDGSLRDLLQKRKDLLLQARISYIARQVSKNALWHDNTSVFLLHDNSREQRG
jgi:hypothetical protein